MKNLLTNLQEALTFQLKGLYDAEKQLKEAIPKCGLKASSISLRNELNNYAESIDDKLLKLERIFSYLMEEPTGRSNKIMKEFLKDTHHMLEYASGDRIRDVLIISCIQNINHYKISGYGTAQSIAMELEIATIPDLLHEILNWEKQTDRKLTQIALQEVNIKAT